MGWRPAPVAAARLIMTVQAVSHEPTTGFPHDHTPEWFLPFTPVCPSDFVALQTWS
jgi:hypothetical protein